MDAAIQCIYRDMEYAKSLVREKAVKSGMLRHEDGDGGDGAAADYDDDDEPEESWTFVGDDDPMQQSMILTPPDNGRGTGVGSESGAQDAGGGYKALGGRFVGIATAPKQ